MMDMIVKLAEEKYIFKYQETKSYSEAVLKLWEEHLNEEMISHGSQEWRNERYWNEECDMVLKYYNKTLQFVYQNYSKKKVKPGQTPFMSLDELSMICSQMGLDQMEHWPATESLFAYNLAMQTQVDELCSDRIFQMSITEFYEAVARLAEKASFLPLPGAPGVQNVDDESEWPLIKRKDLKLGYKMEGFVIKMLQFCTTPTQRSTQPHYEKSIFWVDPDDSEYEED